MRKNLFLHLLAAAILLTLAAMFVQKTLTDRAASVAPSSSSLPSTPGLPSANDDSVSLRREKSDMEIIDEGHSDAESKPASSVHFTPDLLKKRKEAGEAFSETVKNGIPADPDQPFIYQGDLLFSLKKMKQDPSGGTVDLEPVFYWNTGVIPYVMDASVGDAAHDALAELSDLTRWKFIVRTHEKDFVHIKFSTLGGCQSYLGREGGEQAIELSETCTKGQVLHELMHTLGFIHEQSREDRDSHLVVLWENILPNKRNQFIKFPAFISEPVAVPFDYDSLLLYPSLSFSADQKSPTLVKPDGSLYSANRETLSPLDIKKANLLFEAKVDDDQTNR